MDPFVLSHRVRYHECDQQGHAFNAIYLQWFDVAHTEMLRARIGGYRDFTDRHGLEFVVGEAQVRFLRGARFDEEIAVEVVCDEPGRTSLVSRFTVRAGEERLAEGSLRHVCVGPGPDGDGWTSVPWPDEVRAALSA